MQASKFTLVDPNAFIPLPRNLYWNILRTPDLES